MTGVRDITQLCCSPNLAGIVANKIEQSFYSVYSYSGIESIEHAISVNKNPWWVRDFVPFKIKLWCFKLKC